jgi:adenylate cyclase
LIQINEVHLIISYFRQPIEGVRAQSMIGRTAEAPHSNGPSRSEAEAYVRALLGRDELDLSERNRRFLSYIAEETLAGRADRIKAYNIALAAFDRPEDFDPLTDPIVRIEASRLRRSLEHYYLTAGKTDPIEIAVPKGSYVATFKFRDPAPGAETKAAPAGEPIVEEEASPSRTTFSSRKWLMLGPAFAALVLIGAAILAYVLLTTREEVALAATAAKLPSILVMPFEDVSESPSRAFIARGITYETIAALTRFDDLFVFGAETSFGLGAERDNAVQPAQVAADYVLSGSVQATDTKVRVSAILSDFKTGQYVWSQTSERALTASNLMSIQEEIAAKVADAIAQPYGIVFSRSAKAISSKPAQDLMSYECVVRFRQYWRSYSNRDFGSMHDCLTRTIADNPSYAQAYGSLALLYVDAFRFGFGPIEPGVDPLKKASELADKAMALDPNATQGYLAKSMALWFQRDVDGGIAVARRGLEINPHNTDLLADLGLRLAQRARWAEAMPLINEAYARNPGAPMGYRIATFLHAYMTGDYQAALDAALQVKTIYGAMARAMAYAQLGQEDNARQAVSEMLQIDPNYADHMVEDLARRNHAPEIDRAILDGLAKAGLSSTTPSTN